MAQADSPAGRRFASADSMHEAVFRCLVARGQASYSAYLSYRTASEGPLASLLFDELNHGSAPLVHPLVGRLRLVTAL